jgi:uncharacterized membrane protein YfcA
VVFAKIPIKLAIGTSLLIITVKSLIGFLGDLGNQSMDWNFLLTFSLLSIIGIFIGSILSKRIDPNILKKGFGWFVLAMALFIFAKQIF